MKNQEVKDLKTQLESLINYCIENDVKNFTLHRLLQKNLRIITAAIAEVNADIDPELIELEHKMFSAAKEKFIALPKEEQDLVPNLFLLGHDAASEEDKKRHAELMVGFNALMDEESDIKLFILEDVSKVEQANLNFEYHSILENFLKQE